MRPSLGGTVVAISTGWTVPPADVSTGARVWPGAGTGSEAPSSFAGTPPAINVTSGWAVGPSVGVVLAGAAAVVVGATAGRDSAAAGSSPPSGWATHG